MRRMSKSFYTDPALCGKAQDNNDSALCGTALDQQVLATFFANTKRNSKIC
jgi:hypothetical protein